MAAKIVIAGSTGALGERIVRELLRRGAEVVALVRSTAKEEALNNLHALGATVVTLDLLDSGSVTNACRGAACVVSALAGLRDVIVDTQKVLLEAAIKAEVPRFIPSDFSTDFTKLPPGENRNFDLRREFHEILDVAPIASTAIFNGAFAEILQYNIPILDFKKKTIGYWGSPDHRMDFTTMDDTAAYTAGAALDPTTPSALRIASFQVSPHDLARLTEEILKAPFDLVFMGTIDDLRAQNKSARAADPEGENQLYSRWQQGQYLQSMLSTEHESLDNGRYADLTWATPEEVLKPGK